MRLLALERAAHRGCGTVLGLPAGAEERAGGRARPGDVRLYEQIREGDVGKTRFLSGQLASALAPFVGRNARVGRPGRLRLTPRYGC